MENFRKFMTKGECLFSALLQTFTLALQFSLFFLITYPQARKILVLSTLLQLAAFAFHWYRYLAYDKKQQEERQ